MGAMDEGIYEGRVTLASAQPCKLSWFQLGRLRSSDWGTWTYDEREAAQGIRGKTALYKGASAFVLTLLVFCALPSVVFAATNIYGFARIIYGPVSYVWEGVTYYQYGVAAYSNLDAAAVTLGFNPDDFTEEQKAKLSNESTGGAFWTYAQLFTNPPIDGLTGSATGTGYDTVGGASPGFWTTAYGIYGEGNVWYAEVTGAQRIAAQIDLRVVLAGGGNGGSTGSGTSVTTNTVEFTLKPYLLSNTNTGFSSNFFSSTSFDVNGVYKSYASDTCYTQSNNPSTNSVTALGDVFINVTLNLSKLGFDYTDYDFYLFGYPRSRGLWYFEILAFQKGHYNISYNKTNRTFTGYTPNLEAEYTTININTDSDYYNYSSSSFRPNINADNIGTISYTSSFSRRTAGLVTLAPSFSAGFTQGFGFSGGESNTVPPTQWPDTPTPTTPDPPTVDPPTTPTEPTNPTSPTPPTYPPEINYPDVTYTDADISAVLDAMNEHCEHITSAVYNAGASLYSSLSTYLVLEFSATRGLMRSLSVWEVEAIGG